MQAVNMDTSIKDSVFDTTALSLQSGRNRFWFRGHEGVWRLLQVHGLGHLRAAVCHEMGLGRVQRGAFKGRMRLWLHGDGLLVVLQPDGRLVRSKVCWLCRLYKDPTPSPTDAPTLVPTALPTPAPTAFPSRSPTFDPTSDPTRETTCDPTRDPTRDPSRDPTAQPTEKPTYVPTLEPTTEPTLGPTLEPTTDPTDDLTQDPTRDATDEPTTTPSLHPTMRASQSLIRSNERLPMTRTRPKRTTALWLRPLETIGS